jgi:hypothetical protein
MNDSEPILDLDALLDSSRLAAAWHSAGERTPIATGGAAAPGGSRDRDAARAAPEPLRAEAAAPVAEWAAEWAAEPALGTAVEPRVDPATGPVVRMADDPAVRVADEPIPAPPRPVAQAHRELLDEIERTLAASPGLARARRALAAPLAELARALAPLDRPGALDPRGELEPAGPLDLGAVEPVLDQLEDVLCAVLSAAGWPASGAR